MFQFPIGMISTLSIHDISFFFECFTTNTIETLIDSLIDIAIVE